jgi:hypothetical protein
LAAGGPQSFMMSGVAVAFLPLTKLAKSTSPPLVVELDWKAVGCLAPDLAEPDPLLEPSSWSLRVCSLSMREDRDLIKVMKAWNCSRSRRGPRLKLQRIGSASIARNSESTTWPICLNTLRAAICSGQLEYHCTCLRKDSP